LLVQPNDTNEANPARHTNHRHSSGEPTIC
jgi:hypothetical protein